MANDFPDGGVGAKSAGGFELLGAAAGLGFAAAYKRDVIKNAPLYDQLYPTADNTRVRLSQRTTAAETAATMASLAPKYAWQTAKVAETLRRGTTGETLQAVWNHVYNHFQYELDKDGTEEVRTPARSWADRFRGIDCDCMSFLIATILHNLHIRYEFRVTKYDGGWQHVYIVVPASMHPNGYYTIDCVLDRFDYEKNFSGYFNTRAMGLGIPFELLGDPAESDVSTLENIITGKHFNQLTGLGDASGADQSLLEHLKDTRKYIAANPQSVLSQGGAAPYIKMIDYAVTNWNTPNREAALDLLEKEEERWNNAAGFSGCMSDSINGFGAVRGEKKFFAKIKEAAGKVKEAAGNAGEKIKNAAQKAVKAVVRFNPLTLAMRGGLLLAFKINLFKMAEMAYPGTRSNAAAGSKLTVQRLTNLFEKIGGREDKLLAAIQHGYARKHELEPDGVRPSAPGITQTPGPAKPSWVNPGSVDPSTLPTPVPGQKKGGANSTVEGLGLVDPVTDTALLTAVPVILEAYNVIVNNRAPGEVNGLGCSEPALLRTYNPSALGAVSSFPLKKGSKGQLVQMLQEGLLATFGKAALPKYGADGSWGAELDAAVAKYKLKSEIDEPTLKQYILTSFGTVDPGKVDWGTTTKAASPEGEKNMKDEATDEKEAPAAAAKSDRGKFKQLIQKWLARRKNKRAQLEKVAADTTAETKQDDTKQQDAGNNTDRTKIGDDKPGAGSDAPPADEQSSGIGAWVKANPGKTAAGVLIIGTGITLAVSSKAREFFGFGGKKTPSPPPMNPRPTSLTGAGKKKKRKIQIINV